MFQKICIILIWFFSFWKFYFPWKAVYYTINFYLFRHVPASSVQEYNDSGDVTLAKKRGADEEEEDEKPVAKKIKVLMEFI